MGYAPPMSESLLAQRVAADVRAEMARQQCSVQKLAEGTGMPYYVLSRRTRGLVPFDVDELTKVADYLGLSAADLLVRNDATVTGGAA